MLLTACLALLAATQPAIEIESIVNAASLLPPRLAVGAVPAGAQMLVRGRNLGPGGVVRLTRGAAAWKARTLRAANDSILAVAPVDIPPGPVQVVVEHDGLASAPFAFEIAPSGFAIFTMDAAGAGRAIDGSVARGATVSIHGTGLARTQERVELFVGGRAVRQFTVTQDARGEGKEQIHFQIPASTPRGCFVPVQVRVGGARPSNVATVAVEPDESACLRASRIGNYIARGGRAGVIAPFRLAFRTGDKAAGSGAAGDGAIAAFREGSDSGILGRFLRLPAPGTCMAWSAAVGWDEVEQYLRRSWLPSTRLLDGGAIRIESGDATRTVPQPTAGSSYYYQILGGAMPGAGFRNLQPLFLKPGELRVRVLGGPQVDAFPVRLRMPEEVRWINNDAARRVARDRGLTVKWRSSKAQQWVAVVGISSDQVRRATAGFLCVADARAKSLHVPAPVLQTLPASNPDSKQSRGYVFLVSLSAEGEYLFFPYSLDALVAAGVYIEGRASAFE